MLTEEAITGDSRPSQSRLKRIALAAVPALLYLLVSIPNTGRIVVDTSTKPPAHNIVDRPKHIAVLIGILVLPLACIVIPVRRPIVQAVGWLLLWTLVLLAFSKGF